MSAVLRSILSFLLLIAWSAAAGAADSPFPDIQRILDKKILVVAILARDAPPMIMSDDDGNPIGHEVDLANDIGDKLGVAVEFVRSAKTYDDVVEVVARGEADVAVSFVSRSVERAKRVYFTRSYVRQSARIIYSRLGWAQLRERHPTLRQITGIDESAAAAEVVFGILKGSVYARTLKVGFPQIKTEEYESFPEIMAAIKERKIFGGYHGEIQIKFFMRQHPAFAIHVGTEPPIRDPSDIAIAVRPDAPNLVRWLDIYLENRIGELDAHAVIERYEAARAQQTQ